MNEQNNPNEKTVQPESMDTPEEQPAPAQEPPQSFQPQDSADSAQLYAPYGAPQYAPAAPPKKSRKGLIAVIIIAAVVIAAAVICLLLLMPPAVDDISFAQNSLELRVDETEKIIYTITPTKAEDRLVTWTTSNASVVSVSEDGTITAIGEGTCKILGVVGGKSDELDIIVKPAVDDISFVQNSLELRVDETEKIIYTITPAKAGDMPVTWTTSNASVAVVSENGTITAIGEGTCKILGTVDGKSDELDIIVKSSPDFQAIYDEYCNSSYATLAQDGSYLSIDTNPYDIEDYVHYEALYAILQTNETLGLPDSLYEEMSRTRALDGRQSEEFDDVTVSWSYHPDKGLQVLYKAK